jgi:hypothetical protein
MIACTSYGCQVTSPGGTADTEPESGRADADRARLTKSAVVDRALRLADSVGLEALTIRKLTTELGVMPMALYWHFRKGRAPHRPGRARMDRDRRGRGPGRALA